MLLQAFYPSSIAQEKWKEVALDDKNVHLDDKDIEKLVHQQKLEDFQRFLPVWKAVVAGTGEAFTEAGVNTFDQFVDVSNFSMPLESYLRMTPVRTCAILALARRILAIMADASIQFTRE